MRPSEVFGVVVRTVGLILLVAAVPQLGIGLLSVVGGGPASANALLIGGVPAFIIGLWFLRGAQSVVRFAFPDER